MTDTKTGMAKTLLISVLFCAFITGCGSSTTDDIPTTSSQEGEAAASVSQEVIRDQDDTAQKNDDTSAPEESDLSSNDTEPTETDIDSEEVNDGWQDAYLAYLDEHKEEAGTEDVYSLIYVDGDDVPELVINTGFEAGGCRILTYHGGLLDVLQTARLHFTYIENENLLNNSEGNMGYYYDNVYTIHNGRWVNIFSGEYSEFDPNSPEDDYDEELGRYNTLYYYIDGRETDKDTYIRELSRIYDLDREKEPEEYMRYDDLRSYLKNGRLDYEGHRYELCVEDCTWDEAERKCREKGGYLVSLTSNGEFELVENMIRDKDLTKICFYVGAKREDYDWKWIEPGLKQRNCLGTGYYEHWLDGGPSYTDTLPDGTEIEEDRVELLYRKSEDAFYLNDIPNDVIGCYPSFKGKIGYICEYDR